jgi:hypothetical protein
MTVQNGEAVDMTAEKLEKPPKKKRRVTKRMIAANRMNATKSTGPSIESRANTRFNGTRHGMASREIMFMQGEDPQEFWAEVDRWCRERGIQTTDERTAVASAVYSVWVKARIINAQAHNANDAIDTINHTFADQKVAQVRDLLDDLKAKPEVTIAAVMNTSYGCSLLIKEFKALGDRLKTHCSFEVSQREHALRLGGHRPKELFTNKVVEEFNRSYFGSLHGPGGFTAAQAANALMYDRPKGVSRGEFERRLERLVSKLPTIEEGHAKLKKYVQTWISRLRERKELMEYREERQKQAAIGKALADVSADGQVLVRYANQADRTFNTSMKLALTLKAERRKFGDGELDDPAPKVTSAAHPGDEADPASEVVSAAVETDPRPAVEPAAQDEKPTEAVATQVAGPIEGNNAVSPAPAVLLPTSELTQGDPLLPVIEKYRKEFADRPRIQHLE